jgi:microcystin-dependent protein
MKNWRSFIGAMIAVALVSAVAQASVWQWSKTAGTNATADPSINWAEGMPPSAVNDSARAMMARIAEWRDDTSGLLATGGTSTAYTVTTNQGLNATPNDGQLLSVTPHATNGASATLAADGGTAFPIQTVPGTAVAAGVLVQGTPYSLKFNVSASAWILRNYFGQPFAVPLGTVLDYAGTSAPNSNFALAFGQCVSRTTYSQFFAQVGTAFGACDGSTTFGLPDLRGRGVFGLGNMGGSDAGRITVAGGNFDGTVLGGTGGAQNHTLTIAEMPNHTHTGTTNTDGAHQHTGSTTTDGTHHHTGSTDNDGTGNHAHTVTVNAGTSVTAGGGFNPLQTGVGTVINTNTTGAHVHNFTTTDNGAHFHNFDTGVSGAHAHNFTTAGQGGGGAHTVLPPTIILAKIIRIF